MRASLAVVFSAILLLGAAPDDIRSILRSLEELNAAKSDPVAWEARMADYGGRVRLLGPPAIGPLSAYVADPAHPIKVRLFAAAFLGLLEDPAALPALRDRALDPNEDAGLRAVSLQSISSLKVHSGRLRPIYDKVAADPNAPEAVVREALAQLAWIGSDSVEAMVRAAKKHGPDPRGLAQSDVVHALEALARSPTRAATAALLELLRYYLKGSPLRSTVLAAIDSRRLSGDALRRDDFARIALVAEEEQGANAVAAARLLGRLGDRRATGLLVAVLRSPDPAVVAESAEALARVGDPSAAAPLRRLKEGLLHDPRFEPRPGRPDTGPFATRIEKALTSLLASGLPGGWGSRP